MGAKLKFLHSESTLDRLKLGQFRRLSTPELRASMAPARAGRSRSGPMGPCLTAITASKFSWNEERMWTSFHER